MNILLLTYDNDVIEYEYDNRHFIHSRTPNKKAYTSDKFWLDLNDEQFDKFNIIHKDFIETDDNLNKEIVKQLLGDKEKIVFVDNEHLHFVIFRDQYLSLTPIHPEICENLKVTYQPYDSFEEANKQFDVLKFVGYTPITRAMFTQARQWSTTKTKTWEQFINEYYPSFCK